MKLPIFWIFGVLSLAWSCTTYSPVVMKANYAAMYNPSLTVLHPEFLVQVKQEDAGLVLVRLLRDELLFSRANKENRMKAQVSMNCRVYADPGFKTMVDSITIKRDLDFGQMLTYVTVLKTKLIPNTVHFAKIKITDETRLKSIEQVVEINNTEIFGGHRNYVSIIPKLNGAKPNETYSFYPWVPDSFAVRLYSNIRSGSRKFVAWEKDLFGYPKPPYIPERDSLPKTKFRYTAMGTVPLLPVEKGFYFFAIDTLTMQGVGKVVVDANFPNFDSSADLIDPLVYLATESEFKRLKNAANKKIAVDEFWIASAKDYAKAKQMIRIYYNRAKYANIYFTALAEGWKTDRGMVFMVLGPPERVERTDLGERWFYGMGNEFRTVTFDFVRVPNPFSTNHLVVQSKMDHRHVWTEGLKAWRNGQVYNGDERIARPMYEDSEEIK